MLLISHRGNLTGPKSELENSESYIMAAISAGFDVEIDVWGTDSGEIFLGHDAPQYKTSWDFLAPLKEKLWVHCKNLQAMYLLSEQGGFNFFWHQNDDYNLTSKGYFFTYPGQSVSHHNVLVVLEKLPKEQLPKCFGICSDYVADYK